MSKVSSTLLKEGSRNSNEPRLIGEILRDYLRSNSPFATNYAKWKEQKQVEPSNAESYGRNE